LAASRTAISGTINSNWPVGEPYQQQLEGSTRTKVRDEDVRVKLLIQSRLQLQSHVASLTLPLRSGGESGLVVGRPCK
jgi:hypothetical protein